jgi:hypothetical protein
MGRTPLCEAPFGPFQQRGPSHFFRASQRVKHPLDHFGDGE